MCLDCKGGGVMEEKECRWLLVRTPLTEAGRQDKQRAVCEDLAKYKKLEDRKKAFSKRVTALMKEARKRADDAVKALADGYVEEKVFAERFGDNWFYTIIDEMIPTHHIVSDEAVERQLDLFDSPAAIDALAEFEGEVSSADHERVVVTLRRQPGTGRDGESDEEDGQDEQGMH